MTRRAAVVALVLVMVRCADGGGITDPPPDVAGSWLLARMLLSSEGCDALIDPAPILIAVRSEDGVLEVDMPVPLVGILDLRGRIEADGSFEVRWDRDAPAFSRETIVVEGSFMGQSLTALESSMVAFLDPALIELFGGDHCDTVVQWEGNRA